MSIQELIETHENELKRLWNEEIALAEITSGDEHYLTMSEDIGGQRFPIVVQLYENGIAEGEIISNGFFEEIVAERDLEFDVEVPSKVKSEIMAVNMDAR